MLYLLLIALVACLAILNWQTAELLKLARNPKSLSLHLPPRPPAAPVEPARTTPTPAGPVVPHPPAAQHPMHGWVELLQRIDGEWRHHSLRIDGHKDIAEALATPGMAIRRMGKEIQEGVQ